MVLLVLRHTRCSVVFCSSCQIARWLVQPAVQVLLSAPEQDTAKHHWTWFRLLQYVTIARSVRLSVTLLHCSLLKPLDGMRCHLAWTITSQHCRGPGLPIGSGHLGVRTPSLQLCRLSPKYFGPWWHLNIIMVLHKSSYMQTVTNKIDKKM